MSTKQPIPRRRRFSIRVTETRRSYFTVLAMDEKEARRVASAMAERQLFPHDVEESSERTIDAWKGKA